MRRRREIEEVRAATERKFNSPMAYFRRRADELGLGWKKWQAHDKTSRIIIFPCLM